MSNLKCFCSDDQYKDQDVASGEGESEYSDDDERYITDISKRKDKRRYIKSSGKRTKIDSSDRHQCFHFPIKNTMTSH